MRVETQREIVAEIFDHQAHRTTTMADAVLFHTAIAQCLTAYVETANLDGEGRP